jgi:hypothetical protein
MGKRSKSKIHTGCRFVHRLTYVQGVLLQPCVPGCVIIVTGLRNQSIGANFNGNLQANLCERSAKAAASRSATPRPGDAIALLKADHRQVEEWFKEFEGARSADRKQKLADRICGALRIHTTIEEIFYSAFINANKHHVMEEEQPGGMFAEARASKMDLQELGGEMLKRKTELSGESDRQ